MIAEANRSVARAKVTNVRCLVMDAQNLKFRPRTFDAVISRNTLMFIPDLTLALAEMNRVLKWNGRIAATVWAAARRNPRLFGPLEAARALGVNGRRRQRSESRFASDGRHYLKRPCTGPASLT